MNFKVSQLKSLTAGEVAVDDLIYVIDSNPTDGSVKSKKVTVGDLIDSRIYGISSSQFVLITGYYADPSWITSLDWSKITNAPSFVTSLSALTDVSLSSPVPNQLLRYNGTSWYNWTPTYYSLPAGGTTLQYIDGTGALQTLPTTLPTSTVKHLVKAGVPITKGQAVYVTSADGTNMIVGLASNASESTSSKTMGLLDSTVTTNGFANVVTEGLLSGLDTTGANAAGDPVWLGTNGNLIYGLVNKPYAPNHLVFIGIVTRRNANNGEIFVKPQNGFELDELHNVDARNPDNNDGIFYNSTTQLWEHKQISSVFPTPTLASVTTAGNTTTNAITVGGLTISNGSASITKTTSGATLTLTPNASDNAIVINNGGYIKFTSVIDSFVRGSSTTFGILDAGYVSKVQFHWGGSASFINTGGNLLIGTTTDAGYKLDVNGTGVFRGNLEVNAGVNGGLFINNLYPRILFGKTGTPTWSMFVDTENSGQFELGTGAGFPYNNFSSRLFITNSGNVGIGKTNPTYKLEVFGGIRSAFVTTTAVHGEGNTLLLLSGLNGTNPGVNEARLHLGYNQNDPAVRLNSNGVSVSTGTWVFLPQTWFAGGITSSHNIALTIDGMSNGVTNSVASEIIRFTQRGGQFANFYDAGAGLSEFRIWQQANSSNYIYLKPGQTSYFSSGNLVIGGTTDAGYKLDVNGIARVGAVGSSGQLYIKGFAGTGQYIYLDDGATVWSLLGGGNYSIQENGINRFTVRGGGNVGIGTTTPSNKLDVVGDIEFGTPNVSDTWRPILGVSNQVYPQPFLSVANADPAMSRFNIALKTDTIPDATNTVTGFTGPQINLWNSGVSKFLAINTSGLQVSNGSSLLLQPNSGNVLIGTTTDAGYKLDVAGAGRVGDSGNYGTVFTVRAPGGGWAFDYLYLTQGTVVKLGGDRLELRNNGGTVYIGNNGDSDLSSLTLMGGVNGGGTLFAPIIFGSGRNALLSRETMRIDNQNQFVGIGTTTPSTKLHVSGAVGNGIILDGISSVSMLIQAGNLAGGSGTVQLFAGNNNNSYLRLASEYIREGAGGGLGVNVSRENITAKFQVRGSGSTSATTSFLVQNSSNNNQYQITDDGTHYFSSNGNIRLTIANASSTFNQGVLFLNQVDFSQANRFQIDYDSVNDIGRFRANNGGMANGMTMTSLGPIRVGIGQGINQANASSVLELQSTTLGFLAPRMTTAQINAIASPAEGLQVYNTDFKTICFYDGTAWQRVTSTAM